MLIPINSCREQKYTLKPYCMIDLTLKLLFLGDQLCFMVDLLSKYFLNLYFKSVVLILIQDHGCHFSVTCTRESGQSVLRMI